MSWEWQATTNCWRWIMVSRYFVAQQSLVTWRKSWKYAQTKKPWSLCNKLRLLYGDIFFSKNGDETNVQDLSTFLNELKAEGSIDTFKKATFEEALVHQIHCWLNEVDWKFDFGEFARAASWSCDQRGIFVLFSTESMECVAHLWRRTRIDS